MIRRRRCKVPICPAPRRFADVRGSPVPAMVAETKASAARSAGRPTLTAPTSGLGMRSGIAAVLKVAPARQFEATHSCRFGQQPPYQRCRSRRSPLP